MHRSIGNPVARGSSVPAARGKRGSCHGFVACAPVSVLHARAPPGRCPTPATDRGGPGWGGVRPGLVWLRSMPCATVHRLAAVLACLLAVLLHPVVAEEITGRVVSVADGDTLTVLHGREQLKIRLTEIDGPERGQPFGRRSAQSLRDLCAGRAARVVLAGMDRYQRHLGRVWCAGVDASAEQVRRGLAWVYDQYVTDRGLYAVQEAARAGHKGLWSDPAPVPPWLWRRGITSTSPAGGPRPGATGHGAILGNRRSRVYHLPSGCPSYGKVSPRNQVPFASQEAARAAGYRLAGNCR